MLHFSAMFLYLNKRINYALIKPFFTLHPEACRQILWWPKTSPGKIKVIINVTQFFTKCKRPVLPF